MTATQKPPLTFGSLFAGIGGFDLGFERAGMVCKWQVEIDDYATRVLEKHWPDVRRHRDVRTFPAGPVDEWRVDVICGGFPCQDISDAGTKRGLSGERSGLWREMLRVVRVLRPRFVIVENVSAVLDRGHESILGDMAAIGFDGEWEVLSACAFGAPHARERMFYVFYPHGSFVRASRPPESEIASAVVCERRTCDPRQMENWWSIQPEPCSVVYGLPGIVDELRGYGNSIVPVVAEYVGSRVVESYETG